MDEDWYDLWFKNLEISNFWIDVEKDGRYSRCLNGSDEIQKVIIMKKKNWFYYLISRWEWFVKPDMKLTTFCESLNNFPAVRTASTFLDAQRLTNSKNILSSSFRWQEFRKLKN